MKQILFEKQNTGMVDKKGQSIFEGDITDDGGIVRYFTNLNWDSGGSIHAGFYCEKWFEYEVGNLSYNYGFDKCIIVGNVYTENQL